MRTLLKEFCKLKVNYYFCSVIINTKTMNTDTNTEWARASMKFIFNLEYIEELKELLNGIDTKQ